MKRTFRILITIAIFNLPISCTEDDCNFTPVEARINELTATVGIYESTSSSLSMTEEFERAAIYILINKMEYSEISQAKGRYYSILNSAHACSPPEPEPTQAINSIKITSDSTLYSGGREYLSGENLVDLFTVAGFSPTHDATAVNKFIRRQNQDLWIFGYEGANAIFQLLDKPDRSVKHKFKFQFEFSDLEVIEVETSVFEVDI